MRVIAGKFRGMRFDAPETGTTRPVTDRIKETIFNILGHRYGMPGMLPDFDVMDVFAGSGGLGIEALSRGARSCVFVERDRRVLGTLRANLERLRGKARFAIRADNAWTMRFAPAAGPGPETAPGAGAGVNGQSAGSPFDGYGIIFMDPPYADTRDELRIVDMMERAAPALAAGGVIVFRFPGKKDLWDIEYPTLAAVDRRDFSNMRMVLLQRRAELAPAPEPNGPTGSDG